MNEKQVLNFKLRSYKGFLAYNCVRAKNENINMEVDLRTENDKEKLIIKNLNNGKIKAYINKIPKQYQLLYDSMKVYGALIKPEDEKKLETDLNHFGKLDILGLDIGVEQSFARFTNPHHIILPEPVFQLEGKPARELTFNLIKSRIKSSSISFTIPTFFDNSFNKKKYLLSEEEIQEYYEQFETTVIEQIKDKQQLCYFDFYPNKYKMVERLNINKMLNLKIKRELEKEVI